MIPLILRLLSRIVLSLIFLQLVSYPIAQDYRFIQTANAVTGATGVDGSTDAPKQLTQEELDAYYAEDGDSWKEQDHRYCSKDPEGCADCENPSAYNECDEMPETTKAEANQKGACFRKYQDQKSDCLQARESNYLDARQVVYENDKDELGVYILYLAHNLLIMTLLMCPSQILYPASFIAWVASLTWTIGEIVTNKKLEKALDKIKCDLLEMQARGNITDITKDIKIEKIDGCKSIKVTEKVDVQLIKNKDPSADTLEETTTTTTSNDASSSTSNLTNYDKYGLDKNGPKVMESDEYNQAHGNEVAKARYQKLIKKNQHMIFYKKYRDSLQGILDILKEKKAIWHAAFALYFTSMSVAIIDTIWFVIVLYVTLVIFLLLLILALLVVLLTEGAYAFVALVMAGGSIVNIGVGLVASGTDPGFCALQGLGTFVALTGMTIGYCTAAGIKHDINGDLVKSADRGKLAYQKQYGKDDKSQSYDYSSNSGQFSYDATRDGQRQTSNASDDVVGYDASGDPITRQQIDKVTIESQANSPKYEQRDGDAMNKAFLEAFTQLGGHGDMGACALFGCMAGVTPLAVFGVNQPPGKIVMGLFLGTLGAVLHDKFLKKKIDNIEERIEYMDNLMLKLSEVTGEKNKIKGSAVTAESTSTSVSTSNSSAITNIETDNSAQYSAGGSSNVTTLESEKKVCTCNGNFVDCSKINSTCAEKQSTPSSGGTDPKTGKTTTLLSSGSPELSGIDKHMSENLSNIGSGKIDTAKLETEAVARMAMMGRLKKEAIKELARQQNMSEKDLRRMITKPIVDVANMENKALKNALDPIKKAGKMGEVNIGAMADLMNMFKSSSNNEETSNDEKSGDVTRPGITSNKGEEEKKKSVSSFLGGRKTSFGSYTGSGGGDYAGSISSDEKEGALEKYMDQNKDTAIHKDDVNLFERVTNAYYRALKYLSE